MNQKITGFAGSTIINLASLIIIFAGVIYARSFITPLLLAIFISIICAQPIDWLERKKVPRWIALITVILGMVIVISGFVLVIGGTISSFTGDLSNYETTLTDLNNSLISELNEYGMNVNQDLIPKLIQPAKIIEYTASVLNTVLNMMGNTFIVFLIIVFMLLEFGSFSVKAMAIRNESNTPVIYFATILRNIRQYLAIKTLLCLATGILVYLSLVIIGVEYPLLWALIAALMNYIPNIGSIIATVPTFVFALVQLGLGGALWTLGASLVIHNVLGNFVEPKIMGKGLGLSTLVVFLSLIFWGFVLGLVGMFLSVPITMTIKIFLEQNEKTKWIAILLGTPDEASNYLEKRNLPEI